MSVYKEFGEELVIYFDNTVCVTEIDGISVPYHQAFIKSTKQKDHSTAIRWCKKNTPVASVNLLKNCRIVTDSFSNRRNHKIMKLMFELRGINYVVDYTVDQLLDVLSTTTIEKGVFSDDLVIVYDNKGKELFITATTYNSTQTKTFKLTEKNITIGTKYSMFKGERTYLGKIGDKFVFAANTKQRFDYKIKRDFITLGTPHNSIYASTFEYRGITLAQHNKININDLFQVIIVSHNYNKDATAVNGTYIIEYYDKLPKWTISKTENILNEQQCDFLKNKDNRPVTVDITNNNCVIEVHPLFDPQLV